MEPDEQLASQPDPASSEIPVRSARLRPGGAQRAAQAAGGQAAGKALGGYGGVYTLIDGVERLFGVEWHTAALWIHDRREVIAGVVTAAAAFVVRWRRSGRDFGDYVLDQLDG